MKLKLHNLIEFYAKSDGVICNWLIKNSNVCIMFMFMLGNFHLNNVLKTNYFAKGLVAELVPPHAQSA